MKYDPKTETAVFLAVKELGEASTDEIFSYVKEQMELDVPANELMRYLRRWKAKKVFALNYHDGDTVWKLADIPAWYASGIMAICKGTTNEEMRDALDGLNERIKKEGRIIEPRGVWGTYAGAELTFETVDPILGGWLGSEDGKMVLPNRGNGRFIPANWFKGWLGSNAALGDLPQSLRFNVQVENAELPDFTPEHYRLKVRMGLAEYEAIPSGTKFKVHWSFPLRGCKLKTLDEWLSFIRAFATRPLRGLGANPFALGGRIRLVDAKPT